MKTKAIEISIVISAIAAVILIGYLLFEPNEVPPGWTPDIERILVEAGVENVDDCLRWAFGEDYKQLEQRDLDDRWRQRHSDLFIIRGADDLVEATRRIADAWPEKPKLYWIDEDGDSTEVTEPNNTLYTDPNDIWLREQEQPAEATISTGGDNELVCDVTREEFLRILYKSLSDKEPTETVVLRFKELNERSR